MNALRCALLMGCGLLAGCGKSLTDFKPDSGPGDLSCGAGTTQCGNQCIALSVDDANCGSCGHACGGDTSCAGGNCLPKDCAAADCAANQVCVNSVRCQEKLCVSVACPMGKTCKAGICEDESCGGGTTPCTPGSVCVSGVCTDVQCVGVDCKGNVCLAGTCYPPDCPEAMCGPNQVCTDGVSCTDAKCVNKQCSSGTQCVEGTCLPESCGAMTCPTNHVCQNGACTDARCQPVTCPSGKHCEAGACIVNASGCDAGVSGGNLQNDVNNCGACNHVCPSATNAPSRCTAGVCTRGPCAAGFFDVDGEATLGCESRCTGTTCTLPDGGIIVVTVPPLDERNVNALHNASSYGNTAQSSASHRNVGNIGEGVGGGVTTSSSTHKNIGGFNAVLK